MRNQSESMAARILALGKKWPAFVGRHGTRSSLLLGAILLLALAVRIYGIQFGLPGEEWDDEPFFVRHALKFGQGDLNPPWFPYPTLYMYVLFLLYSVYFVFGSLLGAFSSTLDFGLTYFTDPTAFYVIGRGMTAFLGVATVLVLYLTARLLYSTRVALLASLFLAVAFLHVRHSHLVTSDVPAAFLASVAIYAAAHILTKGNAKWYILSGLAAGLAISTKYNVFPVAAVFVVAHLLRTNSRWRDLPRSLTRRVVLLAGLASITGFFMGTPFALLDFGSFYPFIKGHLEQARAGWLSGGGYTPWVSVVTDFLNDGVGIYLVLLALAGLAYGLLYRRTKGDLLLGSFVLLFFLLIGSSKLNFPRYWLPILPPLLLFGARLLNDVANSLPLRQAYRSGLIVIVAGLLLITPLYRSIRYDYLISQKYTSTLAREWIEANIPPGSKIAAEHGALRLVQTQEAIYEERDYKLAEAELNPQARSYKLTPPESQENKTLYYDMLLKVPVSWPSYHAVNYSSVANRPLQYYLDNQFDYLVIVASRRNAFLRERDVYTEVAKFYETLDVRFPRVQEFWPDPVDRPGPGIIIYKLR